MKCKILTTFKGSQDGRFTETFEAGTDAELSDYLMECAPKGSFSVDGESSAPVIENAAIITSASRGKRK